MARRSTPVVLAMGPWTSRVARGLRLPTVRGLKGYSATLTGPSCPLTRSSWTTARPPGRRLEPGIFPRPDGSVYVCGMADPAPLPDSPEAVEVSDAACAILARAAGRVSTALAVDETIQVGAGTVVAFDTHTYQLIDKAVTASAPYSTHEIRY